MIYFTMYSRPPFPYLYLRIIPCFNFFGSGFFLIGRFFVIIRKNHQMCICYEIMRHFVSAFNHSINAINAVIKRNEGDEYYQLKVRVNRNQEFPSLVMDNWLQLDDTPFGASLHPLRRRISLANPEIVPIGVCDKNRCSEQNLFPHRERNEP